MRYYAGIGSRETPWRIQDEFTQIAKSLEQKNYILRSGGADGADMAFESGVKAHDMKEIWLPWKRFNHNTSSDILDWPLRPEVEEICKNIYSRWDISSDAVKKLHARNVYQILGNNLDVPVDFVVCWTDRSEGDTGGTMFGVYLAKKRGIPVYNFFRDTDRVTFSENLNIRISMSV